MIKANAVQKHYIMILTLFYMGYGETMDMSIEME